MWGCIMRNPSRSSGWLGSLGALLVAVSLSVVFVCPQAAIGRKAEPVNKDDILNARINVTIKGTVEENRRQHVGSLTITATGKIKNESKVIGLNQYVPEGMNATYKYEYKEIDLDPPRGCPPLALEEQGSGSVNVVSPMAGASDTTGAFLLQVFTGRAGKVNMLQFTKRAGPDTITHLSKEPISDNYMFIFAPVTMKIMKKVRRKCPQYEYDEEDNKRVFALRVPFAEIKGEEMSGSYSWQSKKFPYKNLGMEVTDIRGNITYKPKKEPGNIKYEVNWVFGKVKEIEILKEVKKPNDPKEDWKPITNKQEKVMVGEKIKLKAVVQPGEKPPSNGSWDLGEIGPEGNVIKKYKADKYTGEAIYLDPKEDLKQPEITFYVFKGEEMKVGFKSDEGSAETTLIINKPEYELKINAQPGSTFKEVDTGGQLNEQCWVTSAYTGKAKRLGVQYDGISFTCTLNDQNTGEIQWVQIIEHEAFRMRDEAGALGTKDIDEALDICYPYQYGNNAKDNPAVFVPEQDPDKSELIFAGKTQTNRMYLMFKPKQKESEWVPLKVIPWEWTGALQKTASQWNKEPYITKGPGNVTAQDATKYPVWKKNSGDETQYKYGP
jgi:hypothetical protein